MVGDKKEDKGTSIDAIAAEYAERLHRADKGKMVLNPLKDGYLQRRDGDGVLDEREARKLLRAHGSEPNLQVSRDEEGNPVRLIDLVEGTDVAKELKTFRDNLSRADTNKDGNLNHTEIHNARGFINEAAVNNLAAAADREAAREAKNVGTPQGTEGQRR